MVLNTVLSANIFLLSPKLTGWFWCSISQSGGPLGQQMGRSKPIWGNEMWERLIYGFGWVSPLSLKGNSGKRLSHLLDLIIRKHSAWMPCWLPHNHHGSHGIQRKGKRLGSLDHPTNLPYVSQQTLPLPELSISNKALPVSAVMRIRWNIPCEMLIMALHGDRWELRGQDRENRCLRSHSAKEAPGACCIAELGPLACV